MDQKLKRQHVIAALANDLEFWVMKKLKDQDKYVLELSEQKDLVGILKQTREPSAALCAQLRYNALTAARFSPVIAAHLDLLADQFDPRKNTIH